LPTLASRQHGVISVQQLSDLGWSHAAIARAVRDGYLIRIHRGVYAVGHTRLPARGRWMAAVLACGDGALLSHRAGAALRDLWPVPSGLIDVTALTSRRNEGVRCHRARTLHPDDRDIVDGIPVTALPRIFLDMAEILTHPRLRTLLEQAQRRNLLNPARIDAMLARSNGRRGVPKLRTGLAELHDDAPWTQSELERNFLEFVRAAGLPEPQTNVIVDEILVDCFWPEHNLIAELDGFDSPRAREVFESDRHRRTVHTLAGRRCINITQRMIERTAKVLRADLAALLRTRTS
jgi:Transcriptional regulator, AbiEi antitoxin